jgi:hypothetical protein
MFVNLNRKGEKIFYRIMLYSVRLCDTYRMFLFLYYFYDEINYKYKFV